MVLLFAVPDDFADDLEESFKEKAVLDTEELADVGGGPGTDKVELDLDDAPFLDEDDEEEEQLPSYDEEEPSEEEETFFQKNKKIIVFGSGFFVLLALVLIALLYFAPWKEPPPPPPPPEEVPVIEEEPPPPPEFIVSWDPFWVEHTDDEGKVRFLICRFAAPTPNEKLAWELEFKKVNIRDAIFYYLRNKDLTFLSDKGNVETLKKDLLNVVNQYLSNGQLENLLIEEYLVK